MDYVWAQLLTCIPFALFYWWMRQLWTSACVIKRHCVLQCSLCAWKRDDAFLLQTLQEKLEEWTSSWLKLCAAVVMWVLVCEHLLAYCFQGRRHAGPLSFCLDSIHRHCIHWSLWKGLYLDCVNVDVRRSLSGWSVLVSLNLWLNTPKWTQLHF